MGRYAIIKNDSVINIIILDANQVLEFEDVLDAELVDAVPYGLCIGDARHGDIYTRNIDGEEVTLKPLTPPQQTDYNELYDELDNKRGIIEDAEAALTEGVESIG